MTLRIYPKLQETQLVSLNISWPSDDLIMLGRDRNYEDSVAHER